jgi:hypothetical protein
LFKVLQVQQVVEAVQAVHRVDLIQQEFMVEGVSEVADVFVVTLVFQVAEVESALFMVAQVNHTQILQHLKNLI